MQSTKNFRKIEGALVPRRGLQKGPSTELGVDQGEDHLLILSGNRFFIETGVEQTTGVDSDIQFLAARRRGEKIYMSTSRELKETSARSSNAYRQEYRLDESEV